MAQAADHRELYGETDADGKIKDCTEEVLQKLIQQDESTDISRSTFPVVYFTSSISRSPFPVVYFLSSISRCPFPVVYLHLLMVTVHCSSRAHGMPPPIDREAHTCDERCLAITRQECDSTRHLLWVARTT